MHTSTTSFSLKARMALMPGWATTVEISAPLQTVWDQVTTFDAYSAWNPFIIEAAAQFEVSKTIRFLEDLQQFGQHWIEADFLEIKPLQKFVWQGHFASPFLFTVRHTFFFDEIDAHHTRFSQHHENSGLLIPFLAWRGIYCVSHQGYLAFDQALKARCEMNH